MVIWKKYYNKNLKKKEKNFKNNSNRYFFNYLNVEFKFYFKSLFNYLSDNTESKLLRYYIKPFFNVMLVLEHIKVNFYQSCFYLFLNYLFLSKTYFVVYIIYFNFSKSNTNLQIMDSSGNSEIFYSSGLVNLTGKKKVVRKLVLIKLFNLLTLLKLTVIKNLPVALHLKNVGSYKFLIIKKLKKKFFIQVIKTFELKAYNGCRKKKERRKR